jgi:phosphodiesterase/alkaline phosphatase D-like protein
LLKIAIASCSKVQDVSPQLAWAEIQAQAPDVLLLLGDNIYLRHDNHQDPQALAAELRQGYAQQLAEPNFAALLADMKARGKDVVAMYDDHDFLGNNRYGGDHDPALGLAARNEFIKVFNPRMTGSDVYRQQSFGLVDVIVLDERFYRKSPDSAGGNRDAILGADQWHWFEQAVAKSTAKFLVIASSTTLHTFGDESWEQYPGAFNRLVNLLKNRKGCLVVSGDVHRNATYDDSGVIEIVSSAAARRGIVFGALRKNYGILTFSEDDVRVQLMSLKVSWRYDFSIPLANWVLP